MIRKNDLTDETLDALWEVFGWSMNVLLSGILPERDWSGNDVPSGGRYVAEGWRGSLIQIRGDWEEFLCSAFGFPYRNAAGNMCWMCSASNAVGRLLWTAVGDSAGWRATRRTHAACVAELLAQRRPVNPLFSVVIGLLLSCVMVDVLHCMDLGITAHVVANVFMRCIKKRALGPLHTWRTVNDSTTRSALGLDRKERSPNSKER